MSQRLEGHFRAPDDLELFYQVWPGSSRRGTIIITHGLAEHSDCYELLAKDLSADGWEVIGWDLRGHGRSEGKRGYAPHGVQSFVDDFKCLVALVARERQSSANTPIIAFGHSLGGLVTTLALLQDSALPVAGVALSSPLFGIAVAVPALKQIAARVAARWLPTVTLHNEIQYADLSRDEQMIRSYGQDPLRHDKISPAVYLGMLEGVDVVAQRAAEFRWPLLLMLAGDDRIVDTKSSESFFSKVSSRQKEIHIYPDALHEIFNDLDRGEALRDLRKFLGHFQPVGEK